MPGALQKISMKKAQPKKDWFRIENLAVADKGDKTRKAIVYIYDEIGDSWWGESTSAADFIKEVASLDVDEIELHLNSPGGSVFDGIAIYQGLKSHQADVHVFVDALAASAASFIAMAGDEITMTDAALMMIHDGSGLAFGTASDMRDTADLLDKVSNTVAGIYSRRAGNTAEFWRALMVEEVWYDASEAVDAGLADNVGDKTDAGDLADANNKWDFSVFNYSGRRGAPSPLDVHKRIANQFINKEKAVGRQPSNSTGTEEPSGEPEGTPPSTDPAQDPAPEGDQPTPATEPNEADPPDEEEEVTPATPGVPPAPAPAPAPATAPENVSLTGQTVTFTTSTTGKVSMTLKELVNGYTTLQTFRDESIVAGKKAFVKQLHDDHKITGPQVKATEDFALSLTDDQYDAWKATWDGASGVPMLGAMPGGTSNHAGGGEAAADEEVKMGEIEKCKSIIRSFQQSNMNPETIKTTGTYQTLIALEPTFKL